MAMVPQFCKKDQIYNQVDIKVILESFELLEKILAFLRQSITRLTYVKQECAGPTLTTNAKTCSCVNVKVLFFQKF